MRVIPTNDSIEHIKLKKGEENEKVYKDCFKHQFYFLFTRIGSSIILGGVQEVMYGQI